MQDEESMVPLEHVFSLLLFLWRQTSQRAQRSLKSWLSIWKFTQLATGNTESICLCRLVPLWPFWNCPRHLQEKVQLHSISYCVPVYGGTSFRHYASAGQGSCCMLWLLCFSWNQSQSSWLAPRMQQTVVVSPSNMQISEWNSWPTAGLKPTAYFLLALILVGFWYSESPRPSLKEECHALKPFS